MNQSLCLGRGKAQFHRNSCIRKTDPIQQHLSMGKKAFFVLRKRKQHTEHKTFRAGFEGTVSTLGRCRAAPHWGLFGTAGGPTSSPHPMGATHGDEAAAPAQRCNPNDLSVHAGNGPAVMSQGRAAASLDQARAVPTSSVSYLYSYQQQTPGPIPLQGAGAEGRVTAPLLSCSGLKGATLVLSGRTPMALGSSSGLQAGQCGATG